MGGVAVADPVGLENHNHHRTQLPATRPVGRWRGAGCPCMHPLPPSLPLPPLGRKGPWGKGEGRGVWGLGEFARARRQPPQVPPSLPPNPPKLPMRPYYGRPLCPHDWCLWRATGAPKGGTGVFQVESVRECGPPSGLLTA